MAVPTPPPPPPSLLGDSIGPSQVGTSVPSTSSTSSAEAGTKSSSEAKPWKRPSTLEEVRQSAKSWSLAGDAGLLLYFKQFSQNMLLRTHELEKRVDELVHDTKGMGSKVHNTFNDFLMLSNKQFIENRVYDEEVTQDESTEKDQTQQPAKTREQLESEILPRFSAAVNLGFQVLDDAFTTVELRAADDSDEDEEGLPAGYVPDPIIEPKDMYASRPLPHLIGSAEFFSDETLGLIEVDDDEEESKNVAKKDEDEETSESESETETESEYSESSEEDLPKKAPKKEVAVDSDSEEESSSDEDLFGETKKKPQNISDSDSESEDEEVKQPPRMGIQAELAAKLGVKPQQQQQQAVSKTQNDNDDTDTHSIASKSTLDNQSLLGAGDDVSVSSASKSKKDKKHRTSTKSSDGHKHHHHHHHKKSPPKAQEEESDEDLFGESKQQKQSYEEEGLFGKKSGLFSGGESLFDGEESEDLFSENNEVASPTISAETPEEPSTPTEIKPRTKTTSSGKKIPAGAVSLFGDNTSLFGSSSNTAKDSSTQEDSAPKKDASKKSPAPVKGLFGDGDDELFASEPPKPDRLQEPAKQRRKKTLELFDDGEDDLFASSNKKEAEKGGEVKKIQDQSIAQAKKEPAAQKSKPKPKVVSLFDDDGGEEEDWFDNINPTKTNSSSVTPKISAAPKEDDSSLFSETKQPTIAANQKKKEETKKPSKTKKVASLFDEDEDDLFGAAPSIKPSPKTEAKTTEKPKEVGKTLDKPKEKTKSKSFMDATDAGLFGDEQEDLFNKPTKLTSKPEPRVEKKTTPKSAISFLDEDDDDDDDFFSTPKQKTKSPPVGTKTAIDKEATTEPKKTTPKSETPVSASPKEDENDLFTTASEQKDSKKNSSEPEAQKSNDAIEEDEEIVEKPRKFAGSVSLFGGIDPFAAKKNLKSHNKEKPPLVEDMSNEPKTDSSFSVTEDADEDDDLFATKPAKEKPMKPDNQSPAAKKAVAVKPVAEKPVAKVQDEIKQRETQPKSASKEETGETKKAETPKKMKPSIAFNPATMLPGAVPPVKNVESPASSFEQPATVNSLHHANKDRARVQKKRRPPSRHFLQSGVTNTTEPISNEIPAAAESNQNPTGSLSSKPDRTELPNSDSLENTTKKPLEKKEINNAVKPADILSNGEDDLFSQPFTPSNKSKDSKTTKPKSTSKDSSDIFDDFLDSSPKSSPVDTKKQSNASLPIIQSNGGKQNNDVFSGTKSNSDISGSKTNDESKSKKLSESTKTESVKTDSKIVADDIFESVSGKDNKTTEKKGEKSLEDTEDLFESSKPNKKTKETTKTKKSKEGTNMFKNEIDDDIFSTDKTAKEEKKEPAKKTKKSSRVVTDDDLFGDSGSIFNDVPSKAKDKKKKKASGGKDIFASKDDDIFATGGEKKTKTKKKAEKTTKTKTAKTVTTNQDSAPNIFDDPLSALGGD